MANNTSTFEEMLATIHSEPTYSDDTPKKCIDAQPDYKNEYHRHVKIIENLERENTDLKRTIVNMCKWLFCQKE